MAGTQGSTEGAGLAGARGALGRKSGARGTGHWLRGVGPLLLLAEALENFRTRGDDRASLRLSGERTLRSGGAWGRCAGGRLNTGTSRAACSTGLLLRGERGPGCHGTLGHDRGPRGAWEHGGAIKVRWHGLAGS